MLTVPVVVTAKDEERGLAACLRSLLVAVARAEEDGPRLPVTVVLDDCSDGSERVARKFPVKVETSSGGIVEAQRKAPPAEDFVLFCDADIRLAPDALARLVAAMREDPALRVAYPRKIPLTPERGGAIARALYTYNRRNGFQTRRRYFNGKLFAIRGWAIPTRAALAPRVARLPTDNFYDLGAGIRVDDIYLSRSILRRWGPRAIAEVPAARIWYRPPASLRGMYRTYRRMRREIERLDRLLPETRPAHRRHGVRRLDRRAYLAAPAAERRDWLVFQAALLGCKAWYALERLWFRHLAGRPCPDWPPIEESKPAIPAGAGR